MKARIKNGTLIQIHALEQPGFREQRAALVASRLTEKLYVDEYKRQREVIHEVLKTDNITLMKILLEESMTLEAYDFYLIRSREMATLIFEHQPEEFERMSQKLFDAFIRRLCPTYRPGRKIIPTDEYWDGAYKKELEFKCLLDRRDYIDPFSFGAYLLEHGAKINRMILYVAMLEGLEMQSFILRSGGRELLQSELEMKGVSHMVYDGKGKGRYINMYYDDRDPPPHYLDIDVLRCAVREGDLKKVQLLIENGALLYIGPVTEPDPPQDPLNPDEHYAIRNRRRDELTKRPIKRYEIVPRTSLLSLAEKHPDIKQYLQEQFQKRRESEIDRVLEWIRAHPDTNRPVAEQ
jgi:hypothetical protein